MIAQIFHGDDVEFLGYLGRKYNNDTISSQRNFFIELRNVPHSVFYDSKTYLEGLIREENLLLNNSNEGVVDLLLLTDSIFRAQEFFKGFTELKENLILTEIIKVLMNYDQVKSYQIGNRLFDFNSAYLMGILNVTPDSFSDGGRYIKPNQAVEHALQMLQDGADIIDIGGESTRPGSEPISADEEIDRVIPVIKEVLNNRPDAIISVDTYKSKVALAALEAGAKIVNDISAFTFDPEIADVCSQFNAAAILMHIKGTPKTMQSDTSYKEVISDIYDFLRKRADFAMQKGIKNIIIDPGIGFGKSVKDNFKIIKRLKDFKSLGFPILIGVSRKSFIGKTLDLNIYERDLPTAAIEAVSIINSARIIRTHNIKNGRQIIKLTSEII